MTGQRRLGGGVGSGGGRGQTEARPSSQLQLPQPSSPHPAARYPSGPWVVELQVEQMFRLEQILLSVLVSLSLS